MTLNKSNIDSSNIDNENCITPWTDNYDFKKHVLVQRKSRLELNDSEENKLFKLCEEIYLKFGNSRDITDIVWNYAQSIKWILNLFDNKEVYDKWIIKMEKLLSWEISFEKFSEITTNESNLIRKLILEYSIEDEKDKIMEEFIKII